MEFEEQPEFAAMVELADTQVLKTCDGYIVPVQVRLAALNAKYYEANQSQGSIKESGML